MQNLFLILNFQFQVKVTSRSRWLFNAILKMELLTIYHRMMYNASFKVFKIFIIHIWCYLFSFKSW